MSAISFAGHPDDSRKLLRVVCVMWRLTAPGVGTAGVLTCQAAATHSNASQRIVITGQGIASCFGNDVDTFYEKCACTGSMATASGQHYHAW